MRTSYSGWPIHMCAQEVWAREHQVLPEQCENGVCKLCGENESRVHKLDCEHYKTKVKPSEDPTWGGMMAS